MAVRPVPMLQAMVITTGSGTSAKRDRLRSTPSARQPIREGVAGPPAPRPAPGTLVPHRPTVRRPVPGQPAGRLPKPTAARAGLADGCPGGTLRKAGRPLTCKLARPPLMRQPVAGSEVPVSSRDRSMRLRRRDFRSRARRDTGTPRLTRRLLRCLPLPPGQNRAGRGQATAGRGPMSTGRGPMITRRSPMTIRRSPMTTARDPVTAPPCRRRARRGRLQDQARPDVPSGTRPTPPHRGQSRRDRPRRDRPRRGSRRQIGLGGLPVAAGQILTAVRLPAPSSARPRLRSQRQRPRSKPRRSGPRQRSSARPTIARLRAADLPSAGAGTPFCSASLAAG